MELSRSQLSYIAAINALKVLGATQTTISEFLDVKRPTVNVALKALMQKGYVRIIDHKDKNIKYCLTENGKTVLKQMQHEKTLFFSLFKDYIGISEEQVEEEYSNLYGMFSNDFLEKLASFQESGFQKLAFPPQNPAKRSILSHFENGVYHVPFQVRKFGGMSASMGDKGFIHPAKIVLNDAAGELLLEARVFYYRTSEGKLLKGYLKSLCYYNKNEWEEAEIRDEHIFVIPLKYLMYQNNDLGRPELGQLKIQATASSKRMPVSIAEITFQFDLMETA